MTRDDMTKAQLLEALSLQDKENDKLKHKVELIGRDLNFADKELVNANIRISDLKQRLDIAEKLGLALAKTIK